MNSINYQYLVQHFLENSARRLPDKIALICDDQRLSYQQINNLADQLAVSLIEMGIKRQDRVAIFLDNSVESVISFFGVLKSGAIFIMLSATIKAKKLNYILKDSGARALITHTNKSRIISESLNIASDLKHIVWIGKSSQITAKPLSDITFSLWDDIISSPCSMIQAPRSPCIDQDLATIIYTSGSTGDPKGVMSSHHSMISAALSITAYLENTGTNASPVLTKAVPLKQKITQILEVISVLLVALMIGMGMEVLI